MIKRSFDASDKVFKFFSPNECRSHEGDFEEKNLSRNQTTFKGTDFQIKKTQQNNHKSFLNLMVEYMDSKVTQSTLLTYEV